jgi:hypothetical protein
MKYLLLLILLALFFSKSISSFTSTSNNVAVIVHVGNIKVFKQIVKDYPKFFNKNVDVYITYNNKEDQNYIKELVPDAELMLCENRGMDIGPFLLMIDKMKRYNYYIKIHTKSDKEWRDSLLKPIYNNLNYFLTTPSTGIQMFGAKRYIYNINFDMNYDPIVAIIKRNYPEYLNKYLNYCSVKYNNTQNCESVPYFVAGTIFVFNDNYFDLLKKIKNLKYEQSILETGYTINDPQHPRRTHAWEYLFGYLNYLNNQNIISLN